MTSKRTRAPLTTTEKVVLALLPFTVAAFVWAVLNHHEAALAISATAMVTCLGLSVRALTPHRGGHMGWPYLRD